MEVDTEDLEALAQMDTVYVNLTKREDRRKLIQGEMRAQGLKGRRFPAKTGDEVADSLVAREWHSGLNCLYDKKTVAALHKMSKGERGCTGSHIALWKQCAKRDDPTKPMLILEDDAVLWDRYDDPPRLWNPDGVATVGETSAWPSLLLTPPPPYRLSCILTQLWHQLP